MGPKKFVSSEDAKKALLWLAEAYRGRNLATSPPPESLYDLLSPNPSWAKKLFRADFKLPYVRCLAVSQCGRVIAAGTKAGFVHVVRWHSPDEESSEHHSLHGRWRRSQYKSPTSKEPDSQHLRGVAKTIRPHELEAIRAIGIIGSSIVVAGTGSGTFLIFDSTSGIELSDVVRSPRSKNAGWLRRFSRMIPVSPPGRPLQAGPLMLGLTQGLDVHLLVLQPGEQRRHEAHTGDLKDFLPTWPRPGLRLIDGAWDGDLLWLLGGDGWIYRFRWTPEPKAEGRLGHLMPDEAGTGAPWKFRVSYPHSTFELRRMVACSKGLALLVSNHLTFLPFQDIDSRRCIEPTEARWVFIDQIADISTWAPFSNLNLSQEKSKGILDDWRPRNESVWIVAGSPQPGLHWTRWRQRRTTTESPEPERARGLVPSETPSHQTEAGRVALMAFGCFAEGPSYLAIASRTHRLQITSLLHSSQTLHILDRLMPSLLTEQGHKDRPHIEWSELRDDLRTAGVALWILRTRIYWDLDVSSHRTLLPEALRRAKVGPIIEKLTVPDLRLLVHILLSSWLASDDVGAKSDVFKRWVREVLRRAFQLAPEEPPRLARRIYDEIAKGIRLRSDRLPQKQDIWQSQGHFASFLRKWIINGNTYAIKETELLPRVLWNRSSSYDLDAMVYLAKLTRRRFDSAWQARRQTTDGLPIWDVVTQRQGLFSIHSYTDGALTAVSRSGKDIRWSLAEWLSTPEGPAKCLRAKELKLSNSGRVLNHRLAAEFWSKYHHGPYVRRLVLLEVGDFYLLIGCFRGWRPQDYQHRPAKEIASKKPRLVAILLRLRNTSNEDDASRGTGKAREADDPNEPIDQTLQEEQEDLTLEIVALETRAVCDELYEIQQLEIEAKGSDQIRFLAGTRGVWDNVVTPLAEIRLKLRDASLERRTVIALEVRPVNVSFISSQGKGGSPEKEPGNQPSLDKGVNPRGTRLQDEALFEATHNPCWCLTAFKIDEDWWLWAGFADGRLRCFKRGLGPQGDEYWIEGGGHGRRHGLEDDPNRPQSRTIPCNAAVWQILYIEGLELLAYGTADGVVGLVSLAGLRERHHRPWVHLLHSREMAPILSLVLLREEGSDPRLLSVSQDGYATVYHLLDRQEGKTGRFLFPGFWQDRFPFRHSAQAAVVIPEPEFSSCRELGVENFTTLLVGSGDGGIYKHRLLMPRGSEGRRSAARWFTKLMSHEQQLVRPEGGAGTTPTLAYCVGESRPESYAWLRVLDTGGLEMMRLSFWLQLHDVGQRLLACPLGDGLVDEYLDLLDELTHEAYRRRPFGRDPAKILWEEASKVANRIAAKALKVTDQDQTNQLLEAYNRLNVGVDDLCNRWIGSEQAIEARVLIHSFNVFLDWPDIVLIAWLDPPERALESQRFLLSNAIHRRLGYGEYIVRLETLRVINRAICWAIVNYREPSQCGCGVQIGLLPLYRSQQIDGDSYPPMGFYELLVRVGHLAENHHDSLSFSNPLTSEITRFFALSILLVPECALIVGHTMSECRLLDRGPELSEAIVRQAKNLVNQLRLEGDEQLYSGLRRFEAYCSPRIDLRPTGYQDQKWWSLMTEDGSEAHQVRNNLGQITDTDLLFEQSRVLEAVRALASLERKLERHSEHDSEESLAMAWLDEYTEDQAYFRHSHSYLRHLRGIRTEIQEALERELAHPPQTDVQNTTDRQASKLCDDALRGLEDTEVFEPQRSHYREIILAWRDHIERRGRRAVAVLEAIDKFNRHIYRTSADNFMSNTLELTLQVTPLAFDRASSVPLSQQIGSALEDGHPLLLEIFRNGTDLVEQIHLSGTLLALARHMLSKPNSSEEFLFQPLHEVYLSEIETEIKNAAQRYNMELKPSGDGFESTFQSAEEAVGTRAIWRTIINEWVNNINRHGRNETNPQLHVRLGFDRDKVKRVLLISGTKPFMECLADQKRSELQRIWNKATDDGLDPEISAAEWLFKCAQKVRQPRSSQRISPTSGSGMGVFLIQTICELVNLETSIRLYDLAHDPDLQGKLTANTLKYPLCLEFSWLPPNHEGRGE